MGWRATDFGEMSLSSFFWLTGLFLLAIAGTAITKTTWYFLHWRRQQIDPAGPDPDMHPVEP